MPAIKIPAVKDKFSDQFSRDAFVVAGKIRVQFGQLIAASSKSLGVDPNIVIAFIIVEDMSLNPAVESSAGAIGLMQMTPATAYDAIRAQAPAMTGEQAVVVNRYLPGIVKTGGFVESYDAPGLKDKIKKALTVPEFNIWVGTMWLAQLMKRVHAKIGTIRLDHVIIAYNMGFGNYLKTVISNNLQAADSATLLSNIAVTETRNYIIKLMGVDGAVMAALRTDKR